MAIPREVEYVRESRKQNGTMITLRGREGRFLGHAVAIGTRSGSKPEGNPAPTPIRTPLTPIRIPVQTIPPVIILHFAV